jgi:hypothetical protein
LVPAARTKGRDKDISHKLRLPLPPSTWHEYVGDPTVADAILDRVVHNAHRLILKAPSRRKEESGIAPGKHDIKRGVGGGSPEEVQGGRETGRREEDFEGFSRWSPRLPASL